jgi:hypothetical protein
MGWSTNALPASSIAIAVIWYVALDMITVSGEMTSEAAGPVVD